MGIKQKILPLVFIGPAFLVLMGVVAYPMLYSLYLSFTSYELLSNKNPVFVGFKNYLRLLKTPLFWHSFKTTLIYLAIALDSELIIGLFLSQLIARYPKGRIIRTILMAPMMIAPILVGFQFKWFFQDQVGLVNNILTSIGIIKQPILWLVDKNLAMFSIIVAEVWMSTPFVVIILLAGTYSIPVELFEVANIDGANGWQRFRFITYPMIKPFIYIVLAIRSLDIARAYDVVRIMTQGGPAHRTELLWIYIYKVSMHQFKFAMGSAVSYIAVLLSFIFTIYFFRELVKSRVIK